MKNRKNRLFLFLFLSLFILHTLFSISKSFCEFYVLKIAPFFRVPLSFLSSVFPFSVFESILLISGALALFAVLSGIRVIILKIFKRQFLSYLRNYINALLIIAISVTALFILVFDASYSRVPLNETLHLKEVPTSEENIKKALYIAIDELTELEDEIEFRRGLPTTHSLDFNTLSKKMCESAEIASKKYAFLQSKPFPSKPLALSEPLAYTGISGVFGFFTGEANINTAFADYTIPFTMAHEHSHQLGIGSEREAEFVAFLICMESDLPYVRYSGWCQVAITLLNLLWEYNENAFYEAISYFPQYAITDVFLSAENFETYSSTYADEVASFVNDVYLSSNGDEGVVSYSLSANLFISYILEKEEYLRKN